MTSISDHLLNLSSEIITFDEGNFYEKILQEIKHIFNFDAVFYLNVADYDSLYISHFTSTNETIVENEINDFIKNELYSWEVKKGPYIGTYKNFSIIGTLFQQQTWGIFISKKLLLNQYISSLNLFSKNARIWFDNPYLFYSSAPPIKIDLQSERKYAALQMLYSISEWEWTIDTNDCYISESFLGFFDYSTVKKAYTISDLYYLIGDTNIKQFKECINKVIHNKFQVLEEFKCLLLDKQTIQNIQILFDPVYENNQLISIIGYCRDLGRNYISEKNTLKWYDSDWLHHLKLIPLEWVLHSSGDCEVTFSPLHYSKINEDPDKLLMELTDHLTKLSTNSQLHSPINLTLQLPFSKYQYQLLASKSTIDPLLWRGVLILLSERNLEANNISSASLEQYNQQCILQLLKSLSSIHSISDYNHIIQYLTGLSRHSTKEYIFKDFFNQLKEVSQSYHQNVSINHVISPNLRIPYAQWILSLISFIIKNFHLQYSPIAIECIEPKIIHSKNVRIIEAQHIIEISITTTNISNVPNITKAIFQATLMGTGIDINFSSNNFDWKCTIYAESKVFEQPLLINSQILSGVPLKNIKKPILIIDDDIYNTKTLEILLQSDGFQTITANNGEQALHLVESIESIELIILDLKMPIMDGYEFIKTIKKIEKYSEIPIMVLSANITPDIKENLNTHDITSIIEKPFEMDEMILHIQHIIKNNNILTKDT